MKNEQRYTEDYLLFDPDSRQLRWLGAIALTVYGNKDTHE